MIGQLTTPPAPVDTFLPARPVAAVGTSSQAVFDEMLVHVADLRDQLFEGGHAERATLAAIRDLTSMIDAIEETLARA